MYFPLFHFPPSHFWHFVYDMFNWCANVNSTDTCSLFLATEERRVGLVVEFEQKIAQYGEADFQDRESGLEQSGWLPVIETSNALLFC